VRWLDIDLLKYFTKYICWKSFRATFTFTLGTSITVEIIKPVTYSEEQNKSVREIFLNNSFFFFKYYIFSLKSSNLPDIIHVY